MPKPLDPITPRVEAATLEALEIARDAGMKTALDIDCRLSRPVETGTLRERRRMSGTVRRAAARAAVDRGVRQWA